jgi:hypothetical protein
MPILKRANRVIVLTVEGAGAQTGRVSAVAEKIVAVAVLCALQ